MQIWYKIMYFWDEFNKKLVGNYAILVGIYENLVGRLNMT